MKAPATLRRPELAGIVQWSIGFVMLVLLTVALLSLPVWLFAVRTGSLEPRLSAAGTSSWSTRANGIGDNRSHSPHNGGGITHRLASVNSDSTFVTKGDANKTPDPWVVQPRDTIGAVFATAPHLGYWLVYLKSITGLAAVICALVGTSFGRSSASSKTNYDDVDLRVTETTFDPRFIPGLSSRCRGHDPSGRVTLSLRDRYVCGSMDAAYRGQGASVIDGAVYQPTCV